MSVDDWLDPDSAPVETPVRVKLGGGAELIGSRAPHSSSDVIWWWIDEDHTRMSKPDASGDVLDGNRSMSSPLH